MTEPTSMAQRVRSYAVFVLKIAFAAGVIGYLIASNYEAFLENIRQFNYLWLSIRQEYLS